MRTRVRWPPFAVPATLHADCRLHARASEPAVCVAPYVLVVLLCDVLPTPSPESSLCTRVPRREPILRLCVRRYPIHAHAARMRYHAFARACGRNTDVCAVRRPVTTVHATLRRSTWRVAWSVCVVGLIRRVRPFSACGVGGLSRRLLSPAWWSWSSADARLAML